MQKLRFANYIHLSAAQQTGCLLRALDVFVVSCLAALLLYQLSCSSKPLSCYFTVQLPLHPHLLPAPHVSRDMVCTLAAFVAAFAVCDAPELAAFLLFFISKLVCAPGSLCTLLSYTTKQLQTLLFTTMLFFSSTQVLLAPDLQIHFSADSPSLFLVFFLAAPPPPSPPPPPPPSPPRECYFKGALIQGF